MGILTRFFGGSEVSIEAVTQQAAELAIRELAWEIGVKRIAKAISKCEFRTYENGKEVRNHLYYALNVQPNQNQNATEFWEEFVHKFFDHTHVLMIPSGNRENMEFRLADDFEVDDSGAFTATVFKNIRIKELTMDAVFTSKTAMYFKSNDRKVKRYLDDTMSMYSKLIAMTYDYYKQSIGSKWIFHISKLRENDKARQEAVLTKHVKKLFSAQNVAIPMYEGLNLERLDTGSVPQTRDLKALLDDTLEMTSKALLIPTNIMTGEVTDTSKAVDDFLTFCLDGILELIQDEINRTYFSEYEFLHGTKVVINSQTIKHIDILDMSSSIDKLIGCGAKSINEIMRILGEEPLPYPWADQHFLTLNYVPIELSGQVEGRGLKESDRKEGG